MNEEEKKVPQDQEKPAEEKQPEAGKFTQEDVNNIVKREVEKAVKRLSKQPAAQTTAQPTGQLPVDGTQQTSVQPQMVPTVDPEKEAINRELLLVKAQLSAIGEGVDPAAAEDAVYLALRDAEKADEMDEDGIREALKDVLKRHPEWKKKDGKEGSGGFRFGADTAGHEEGAGRNKALPRGRVIF